MSQITTHVLDTSLGKPGKGIQIILQTENGKTLGEGTTNSDGRVTDLLSKNQLLEAGVYAMIFKTKAYFDRLGTKTFYPEIRILFQSFDQSHYHVPLLLNPFGYSTYRGS